MSQNMKLPCFFSSLQDRSYFGSCSHDLCQLGGGSFIIFILVCWCRGVHCREILVVSCPVILILSQIRVLLVRCFSLLQMMPKMLSALNDRRIISVAAGDQFSVAVDHLGEVWVWGRGESGQVGGWF